MWSSCIMPPCKKMAPSTHAHAAKDRGRGRNLPACRAMQLRRTCEVCEVAGLGSAGGVNLVWADMCGI